MEKNTEQMHELLANISESEVASKQAELQKVRSAFLYDSTAAANGEDDAVDVILTLLATRTAHHGLSVGNHQIL